LYNWQQRLCVDKFGTGRFRTKVWVLLFSSVILTLGAAFRTGTAYKPRPRSDPAWYDSKACFYIFNFTIEIIVVYLYAAIRVDLRFHIPDGAHGPGAYSAGQDTLVKQPSHRSISDRINNEEYVFDNQPVDENAAEKTGDLEAATSPVATVEEKSIEAGADTPAVHPSS